MQEANSGWADQRFEGCHVDSGQTLALPVQPWPLTGPVRGKINELDTPLPTDSD